MEALIIAAIIAYAVKKAAENGHLHWQGAKAASRRGTRGQALRRRVASAVRHDTGYWAHQALNGFPQVRNVLADGWHAGRTAQQQGRAERMRARTEHLEGRVRLIPELREHRRRQDEALQQIRAARRPAEAGSEGRQGSQPSAAPDDAGTPGPSYSWGLAGARNHWPADSREEAGRRARHMSTDGRQREVAEYPPGGGPGRTIATYANGKPVTTPAKGTTMASDVTYDNLLRRTAEAVTSAEALAADLAAGKRWDDQTAEQMQALEVDPVTLSAMSDYLDTCDRAMKAQQAVIEAAKNVEVTLKRGHEGLAEAHKDAPVAAAKRDFYEG